jgi:hypothetical protein
LSLPSSFNETKQDLLSRCSEFLSFPWIDGTKYTVELLSKDVKDLIKQWETAFTHCFNLPVSNLIKKDFIGDLYESYNKIRAAKKNINSQEDAFSTLSDSWAAIKHCSIYSVIEHSKDGAATPVEAVSSNLRKLIKDWQDDFTKRNPGKEMTSEEKRGRASWYTLYAATRDKNKSLSASKKALKDLDKESKSLLRLDAQDIKKSQLVKLKGSWKKHIKEWEKAFLLEQKKAPDNESKLIIKQWYLRYKTLSEKGLELDKLAMERMEADF